MITGTAVGDDALAGCTAGGTGNIVCQAVLARAICRSAGCLSVDLAVLTVEVISGIAAGDAAGSIVAGRGIASGCAVDS